MGNEHFAHWLAASVAPAIDSRLLVPTVDSFVRSLIRSSSAVGARARGSLGARDDKRADGKQRAFPRAAATRQRLGRSISS